jgi:hypothetical protein
VQRVARQHGRGTVDLLARGALGRDLLHGLLDPGVLLDGGQALKVQPRGLDQAHGGPPLVHPGDGAGQRGQRVVGERNAAVAAGPGSTRHHVVRHLLGRLDVDGADLPVHHPDAPALVQRELGVADERAVVLDHPVDAHGGPALLARRPEEDDVAVQAVALGGQLNEGRQRGGEHPLVVDGAAAVQVAFAEGGLEGVRLPLAGVGAHHVHVAHHQHRLLPRVPGAEARDEVGARAVGGNAQHVRFHAGDAAEHRIEVQRRRQLVAGRVLRVDADEVLQVRQRGGLRLRAAEPRGGGGAHGVRGVLRGGGARRQDDRREGIHQIANDHSVTFVSVR